MEVVTVSGSPMWMVYVVNEMLLVVLVESVGVIKECGIRLCSDVLSKMYISNSTGGVRTQ